MSRRDHTCWFLSLPRDEEEALRAEHRLETNDARKEHMHVQQGARLAELLANVDRCRGLKAVRRASTRRPVASAPSSRRRLIRLCLAALGLALVLVSVIAF